MSHFSVLVKITPKLMEEFKTVNAAVEHLMAPFDEATKDSDFITFNDEEDGYRKEFEEGTTTMYKAPDGEMLCKYHERFKVKQEDGFSNDYVKPDDYTEVELKHTERFDSFEVYMQEYNEMECDDETGRYGYWNNPNAAWDYWRIGGRWRGSLKVVPDADSALAELSYEHTFNGKQHLDPENVADVCFVKDIDWERIRIDTNAAMDLWWNKYQKFLETGKDDDILYGIHHDLIQIGMRKTPCINRDALSKARKEFPKDKAKWPDAEWEDTVIQTREALESYRWYWDFSSFCVIEDGKWYEKGKMGWFGCSSDSTEDRSEWGKSFADRFLKKEQEGTVLAMCDCHI